MSSVSPQGLTSVLSVLSAMITPAVLILASGSLILTTSNRLTRVVDRVREMLTEVEALDETASPAVGAKRELLFAQVERAITRARLLQRAMTRLYSGLTFFIATSVSIGIVALTGARFAWVVLAFGLIGAALLFSASILLIFESRIALATTYAEMDYIWSHHLPAERRERARDSWFFTRGGS